MDTKPRYRGILMRLVQRVGLPRPGAADRPRQRGIRTAAQPRDLPGYATYQARTRYRLVPGIW